MELSEGVGESSSPPRAFGGFSYHDIKNEIYTRLLLSVNEDAVLDPGFRELFDAHFNRLPQSYGLDINMDRTEDVLLHQKILELAKDPKQRPVFIVRFVEYVQTSANGHVDALQSSRVISEYDYVDREGHMSLTIRNEGCEIDFEPCSKLENLNLDVRSRAEDIEERNLTRSVSGRMDSPKIPVHEILFSTLDKPKLLSQFSALLSDIGLNIREAHVFSTADGYSLHVFVVDGWPVEDTDCLHEELKKALDKNEDFLSSATELRHSEWEIDRRLLKIGEKIASGSSGDLFRGAYLGLDVSVKVIRSEQLNETLEGEFAQEVMILREVRHKNVVRFIGACTNLPEFCIITEYMPGGSVYDFTRANHNVLELPQLLKIATDVCEGMEYLHENNIIHRDLKTANLLMDAQKVVKVADFGVARFQSVEGVMTAETGTYRWMAPEVINHQAYDQQADVFSFAIVLWELMTAKLPYDNMTPLQAALGVREGLRPQLPEATHPRLLDLMQRCWDANPSQRPTFSDIRVELEDVLQELQET